MFVKVVKHADVEKGTSSRETIYQCGQVSFRDSVRKVVSKATGEDETFKDLMIEMEGCPAPHNDFLAVQCERKKLSVYVMNDTGKTIKALEFR